MVVKFEIPPLRNWILQQIIKISMAEHLSQDVFVYMDSDTALIRPFDLRSFEKEGKIRLFRIPGGGNIPSHYKWHRSAGHLLGIPPQDYYGARYITQMVTWRRNVVLQLYDRIETVHGRNWMDVLMWQWNLSEYILYGVFVDQVLKEQAGHYYEEENISLEYWLPQDMSDQEIDKFLNQLSPHHVTIMVSAKAKMSTERYASLLEKAQARAAYALIS